MQKAQVLFVLGGPGAGKGTQCAHMVDKFGYAHLSAGDLLRAEKSSGSKNGELIANYIKEGKIVPVAITVALLREAIEKQRREKGQQLFLVDGFPRNQDNLDGWNAAMADVADVNGVLFFDCSEEAMQARLLERGKTSGRSDDNLESIKKRFVVFREESMAVIRHFDRLQKVFRVDASTATIAQVSEHVNTIISKLLTSLRAPAPSSSSSSSSAAPAVIGRPKSRRGEDVPAPVLHKFEKVVCPRVMGGQHRFRTVPANPGNNQEPKLDVCSACGVNRHLWQAQEPLPLRKGEANEADLAAARKAGLMASRSRVYA